MTRYALLLLAVGVLVAAPASVAQDSLPIGSALPLADRTMENASGAATSLQQQMGPRGMVVMFWSSTCPWIRRYEDRVIALATEYGDAGVGFAFVNPNDPLAFPGDALDAMREHARQQGYAVPFLADAGSEAARAFGATRTPQAFVFDSQGRLVYEGTIDDSPADARQVQEAYLRDALAALVAGEAPRVEKTRAFGCTIKFGP